MSDEEVPVLQTICKDSGKGVLGRGKNKCKGPESGICLAHSKTKGKSCGWNRVSQEEGDRKGSRRKAGARP